MGYLQAIQSVFPDAVALDQLDPKSPVAKGVKQIETNFTTLVGCLRGSPNARLARLGALVWDIVGQRHVVVAMHATIPAMSFMAAQRKDGPQQGMILVPPSWLDLLLTEPAMAVGGVIFNGSQALDYYNGRIGKDLDPMTLIKARCWNYEAEFLRAVPPGMLNKYQRGVLEMYPNGFDEKLVYEYRPVAPQVC